MIAPWLEERGLIVRAVVPYYIGDGWIREGEEEGSLELVHEGSKGVEGYAEVQTVVGDIPDFVEREGSKRRRADLGLNVGKFVFAAAEVGRRSENEAREAQPVSILKAPGGSELVLLGSVQDLLNVRCLIEKEASILRDVP